MKLVHHLDGDTAEPIIVVIVNDAEAADAVKSQPGVGKPYYAFTNTGLPAGFEASENKAVDFAGAPTVKAQAANNQTAIDGMLATPPTGKLSF